MVGYWSAFSRAAMKKEKWYLYELYQGRFLVYAGLTNDDVRARYEQSRHKEFSRMRIVGVTDDREKAIKWRERRVETYKKYHGGEPPMYNDPRGGFGE